MDITTWYAIAIGSAVVSYIAAYAILSVAVVIRKFGKLYFLRNLFYPQIHRHFTTSGAWFDLRPSGKTTWFDLVLLLAFLLANAIALSINVHDVPGFVRRSGLLPVINLMPLFLGAQMNIIASRCGVSLRVYTRVHRWLGSIAVFEGLIHVTVTLSTRRPSFQATPDIAALVAAASFVVILLSGFLRRRMYEIFLNLHFIIGVGAVAAIYLHTPTALLESPTVYLLAAVCLQILVGTVRFGQILYRNVRYKRPLSRASVRTISFRRPDGKDIPLSDAVHVHVRLSRPWKPRAGQYVYLCIPGVSYTSFAQLHPFYVAWWYRSGSDYYAVFIVQRMRGFTDDLLLHREYTPRNDVVGEVLGFTGVYAEDLRRYNRGKMNSQPSSSTNIALVHRDFSGGAPLGTTGSEGGPEENLSPRLIENRDGIDEAWPEADNAAAQAVEFHRATEMKVVIEGPYGKELSLDSYGTVLLFATGIGIAAQLPYVAQLLRGYRNYEVKTRRIALFWQVDSEIQIAWIADRMQELIKQDIGRILDIHLYILGDFLPKTPETRPGDYVEQGERIDMTYKALDVGNVFNSEMKQRKGRTVISLCANNKMSDEIRRLVRTMMDGIISLKELDFRPGNGHSGHKIGFHTV